MVYPGAATRSWAGDHRVRAQIVPGTVTAVVAHTALLRTSLPERQDDSLGPNGT